MTRLSRSDPATKATSRRTLPMLTLHARLVHPGRGQQLGLHLAGLDAIAAYLEFVVAPTR